MQITAKLLFNNKEADVNSILYNLKSEFCDFYSSSNLEKNISVEQVKENVTYDIEQKDYAEFFVSKESIAFKISIDWQNNSINLFPVGPITDLTFYTLRMLEACCNFAIEEFIASKN